MKFVSNENIDMFCFILYFLHSFAINIINLILQIFIENFIRFIA